jgi:hypothetical protein
MPVNTLLEYSAQDAPDHRVLVASALSNDTLHTSCVQHNGYDYNRQDYRIMSACFLV